MHLVIVKTITNYLTFSAIGFVSLFIGSAQLIAETEAAEGSTIRYLGIGNSFTWNSTSYLGEIAESQGKDLEFFVAGIGGSSMEEHLKRVALFEKDPSSLPGRPYQRETSDGKTERYSLKEILQQEDWDYVSIQQLSKLSFSPHTYEPHAGRLISYIREHAPDAEIIIHKTWAYRKDHPWFSTEMWSQQEMYDELTVAYERLSKQYDLRIVPIGTAFQKAREMKEWSFSFPDPNFNYESPTHPNVPVQTGSLNTGWIWRKNKKTGEIRFQRDSNHANAIGCYLGGLVHFEFLFGESVDPESVFMLDKLDRAQVKSLVEAAHSSFESQ